MKSITVREAQHNFSRVLRTVEAGETVEILSREQPVAKLVPINNRLGRGEAVDWSAHAARMKEIWPGEPLQVSEAALNELRGER